MTEEVNQLPDEEEQSADQNEPEGPQVQSAREQKPSRMQKFKSFIVECRRVLTITKKPTMFEYKTIVKASAIGMAIIGLVGFIVTMIKQLLF